MGDEHDFSGADRFEQGIERREKAELGTTWGRRDFDALHRSRGVECDKIGERSTNIDPNADHTTASLHGASLSRARYGSLRLPVSRFDTVSMAVSAAAI